jgi:thiamine biosynthesis lipoprotein
MMGTVLNLIVYGRDRDTIDTATNAAIKRMLELEGRLSRFKPDSEVGRLNTVGRIDKPGVDLRRVLGIARDISRRSEGAFDITVLPLVKINEKFKGAAKPDRATLRTALALVDYRKIRINDKEISLAKPGMGITLDGIGKGYIVDQGVAELARLGFDNIYVEAGGDLMVKGNKPRHRPWRIGIENPRPQIPEKLVVLTTSNRAVATSGDYMQAYNADFSRNHIVSPATGFSPPELASATITAPSVVLADALATAAMVMGSKKAVKMLAAMPGCEGYFIGKDLKHHQSRNFFT